MTAEPADRVGLETVAREWTRIGLTGFGGPPAHIALLRRLVVERKWIEPRELEEAIGACNLLPGPASTQLALFCAQRVAGTPGVIVGGLGFIGPAVVMMLILSALFLSHSPPLWVRGAGAGAGSAVAAVAVAAAMGLLGPSWSRVAQRPRASRALDRLRAARRCAAAATLGRYLVLVLLACRPRRAGDLLADARTAAGPRLDGGTAARRQRPPAGSPR